MRSWLSWSLLVLLPACVLFGPGASGDDDGDGNGSVSFGHGSTGSVVGPTVSNPITPGDMPANNPSSQPVCAPQGAICTATHLAQQNLTGCCSGLVCKDAAGGARSCQFAGEGDQTLAAQCNAQIPVTSLMSSGLSIETPLESSLGAFAFDSVSEAVLEAGPGGCMSDVMLTLQIGSHANCALKVHAGPVLAPDGGLKVSDLTELDASDCAGFAPRNYSGSSLQGSFVFDGEHCENSSPFGSAGSALLGGLFWCYAGTFELRLDGSLNDPLWSSAFIEDDAGVDGSVSFDQSVVRLTGRLCSSVPADSCPTP